MKYCKLYKLQIKSLPETYLCIVEGYCKDVHFIFQMENGFFEVPFNSHFSTGTDLELDELQGLFRYVFDRNARVQEGISFSFSIKERVQRIPNEHFPYLIPLLLSGKNLLGNPIVLKNCLFNTHSNQSIFEKISKEASFKVTSSSLLTLCATCRGLKNFDEVLTRVSGVSGEKNTIVVHKKSLEALNYLKENHQHLYWDFLKSLKHSSEIYIFPFNRVQWNIPENEREVLNEVLRFAVLSKDTRPEVIFVTRREDKTSAVEMGKKYMNILERKTRRDLIERFQKIKTGTIRGEKIDLSILQERQEYLILPWILHEKGADRNDLLRSCLEVCESFYEDLGNIQAIIHSDIKDGVVLEEGENKNRKSAPLDFDYLIERSVFWLTEAQEVIKHNRNKRLIVHSLAKIAFELPENEILAFIESLKRKRLPPESFTLLATCLYVTASTNRTKYSNVIDILKDHVLTRKNCVESCVTWIKHFRSTEENPSSEWKLIIPKNSLKKIPPRVLKRIAEIILQYNAVEIDDKEELIKTLSPVALTDQRILSNLGNIEKLLQMKSRSSIIGRIVSLTLEDPSGNIGDYEYFDLKNIVYNSFLVLKKAEEKGLDPRSAADFIGTVFEGIHRNPIYISERHIKSYEDRVQKHPDDLNTAIKVAKLIEETFSRKPNP